ncbi:MAG TPA: SseB family protein [Nocardioidaceae bacterium]|nr:SseB family protein [Nocardioidaceae bacterium]
MRAIPEPAFASDDGSAGPEVTAALREVAGGAGLEIAIAALCDARVLVPVVPLPGEDTLGTGESDDRVDMAAVLLTGRDGRRALLAFTDLAALAGWDADARPVPVTTSQAAQSALAEGADALVVDVAGPVQVPVEGDALRRVADGQWLVPDGDGWAWVRPLR